MVRLSLFNSTEFLNDLSRGASEADVFFPFGGWGEGSNVECAKSTQCMPYKNHYDECVERVMEQEKHAASGKKGPREDCVEECEFGLLFFFFFWDHESM